MYIERVQNKLKKEKSEFKKLDRLNNLGLSQLLIRKLSLLQNYLFEQRIGKNILHEDTNRVIASGVNVFKRSVALYLTQLIHHTNPQYTIFYKILDIKGFKSLDHIIDGYNLADYKLNVLFFKLNEEANKLSGEIEELELIVARYGGDEPLISCIIASDIISTDEIGRINEMVDQMIQRCFDEVELEIKDGVETYYYPQEVNKNDVFEYCLNHNLVIGPEDIDKVLRSQRKLPTPNVKADKRTSTPIKAILRHRDVYKSDSTSIVTDLLKFDLQVIRRPLLNLNLPTLREFIGATMSKMPCVVITIDFKFLKEINDAYNALEGDYYINNTIMYILKHFGVEEDSLSFLLLAHETTEMQIGITKDHYEYFMSLESVTDFLNNSVNHVTIDGNSLCLPVGIYIDKFEPNIRQYTRQNGINGQSYTKITPDKSNKQLAYKMITHVIVKGKNMAEVNWYIKLVEMFDEQELISQLKLKKLLLSNNTESKSNSEIHLVCKYFLGKTKDCIKLERYQARLYKLAQLAQANNKSSLYEYVCSLIGQSVTPN